MGIALTPIKKDLSDPRRDAGKDVRKGQWSGWRRSTTGIEETTPLRKPRQRRKYKEDAREERRGEEERTLDDRDE
jgi:hypothetical protein